MNPRLLSLAVILRNDVNGLVTYSKDGLHYNEPVEWKFETGELVNSENTQQHWVNSLWASILSIQAQNDLRVKMCSEEEHHSL